ncbi:hypothetical protein [Massilia endophytica]|uniref:hypothetical protein n=1 Tax=Massilia endophytica TaxID=2899220 RepID=UPI001E3CD530|nr:hypothetical protein [Massilia endophytica]UGQ49116.1 hypothetical protein LSQ66_11825 [Massilia endophytica]
MKLKELKNPRMKRYLAEAMALIVFAAFVDFVFISQMGVRYLGIASVAVCCLLGLFLIRHHRIELENTASAEQGEALAKHKLAAEILAAVAIGSFAITQYRSGLEIDKLLWDRASEHLESARLAITAPSSLCPPDQAARQDCRDLDNALFRYKLAILSDKPDDIRYMRDTLRKLLDHTYAIRAKELPAVPGASLSLWLRMDQIRHEIAVTDTVNDSQAEIFIAQYVFLIFATLTIARKVSAVRFDIYRAEQERHRKKSA